MCNINRQPVLCQQNQLTFGFVHSCHSPWTYWSDVTTSSTHTCYTNITNSCMKSKCIPNEMHTSAILQGYEAIQNLTKLQYIKVTVT